MNDVQTADIREGMILSRIEDLDMNTVLDHAPPGNGSLLLRAYLQNAEIQLSHRQANACVMHIQGKRPVISLNPDFLAQNVENYWELFTLLFHEMAHVMVGHFVEGKVKTLWGNPFWKTQEGAKIRDMSEELLIKHLEHMALPDDHYHTITEKTFRHLGEPMNVFFRGTPPEEITDPFFAAVHRRVFTTGAYSARETAFSMRLLMEGEDSQGPGDNPWDNVKPKPNGNEQQSGQAGGDSSQSDESGEGSPSYVSGDPGESGKPGEKSEPDLDEGQDPEDDSNDPGDADGSPSDDDADSDSEGAEGAGQDGEGDDADSDDGSGDSESDSAGSVGSQSTADAEGMESLLAAMASLLSQDGASTSGTQMAPDVQRELEKRTVANVAQIKREVIKAVSETGYFNQVARVFRSTVGRNIGHSIVPNLRHDKRAGMMLAAGQFVPYYRTENQATEERNHLFFDISGSQDRYISHCNELVLRLKPFIAENGLALFSSEHGPVDPVVPMRLSQFTREVKAGTVQNHSSGGTNFNLVIDYMMKHKIMKAAILTDNISSIWGEERIAYLKKMAKKGYLLVIYSRDKTDYLDRGFSLYANKTIHLELL